MEVENDEVLYKDKYLGITHGGGEWLLAILHREMEVENDEVLYKDKYLGITHGGGEWLLAILHREMEVENDEVLYKDKYLGTVETVTCDPSRDRNEKVT